MSSNYPQVQTKIAQTIVTSSTTSSALDKMYTTSINVPQVMPRVIPKNDQSE